jgi:hypothetical protein
MPEGNAGGSAAATMKYRREMRRKGVAGMVAVLKWAAVFD